MDLQTAAKRSLLVANTQEDLRTEYYLWQVHNVAQDISKAEAEMAKDEAELAGLEATHVKSEAEVHLLRFATAPLAVPLR